MAGSSGHPLEAASAAACGRWRRAPARSLTPSSATCMRSGGIFPSVLSALNGPAALAGGKVACRACAWPGCGEEHGRVARAHIAPGRWPPRTAPSPRARSARMRPENVSQRACISALSCAAGAGSPVSQSSSPRRPGERTSRPRAEERLRRYSTALRVRRLAYLRRLASTLSGWRGQWASAASAETGAVRRPCRASGLNAKRRPWRARAQPWRTAPP